MLIPPTSTYSQETTEKQFDHHLYATCADFGSYYPFLKGVR
jgi:hypothetical protein